MYAADPEALQDALDNLEEFLSGGGEHISLHSATERDAAWAAQARGG
jgi:hypothetical protein